MLKFQTALSEEGLEILATGDDLNLPRLALFVALGVPPQSGCAVLPFAQHQEGSTVFLPFQASQLFCFSAGAGEPAQSLRIWRSMQWSERQPPGGHWQVEQEKGQVRISVTPSAFSGRSHGNVALFAKDLADDEGWGTMLEGDYVPGGRGDKFLRASFEIDLTARRIFARGRLEQPARVRIYQLLPRLFGNTNGTRRPNGTLAENGVGKFADLNEAALGELRAMHFTHLWLTGILRQATSTDYSAQGLPADDPDLLKGLAGSPYAITDCFDLCPDYAVHPADRLGEFRALLDRMHAAGLRAIIDFVPNHVARSYCSTANPELSFGAHDDRSRFFVPGNNFFYLQPDSPGSGPPLRLPTVVDGAYLSPTCAVLGAGDGLFEGERTFGRVTGNNAVTWRPGRSDWYETVKLNYGWDFTAGRRAYPHAGLPGALLPDTWLKMDEVLAYWQELGVAGFRCDMAHMVPPEFWNWLIGRARARQPEVLFLAEAYNNDPMKVPGGDPLLAALDGGRGHVMLDLLNAGFDAVYDDPSYKALKSLYEGSGWANDLETALGHEFIFQHALRYAENHDEVRLANREQWGGAGAQVGRPVAALLFGLSRGPVLVYHGQEVGEPADAPAGYGGGRGRTTIFDYWSMPELSKWVNGHRYDGGQLSTEQRELRAFYQQLLALAGEPAFARGEYFGLNPSNVANEHYGRLPGEAASGHWLFSFLRYDAASGQRFLVMANLHPSRTFTEIRLCLPAEALAFLRIGEVSAPFGVARLAPPGGVVARPFAQGWEVAALPPLSAVYLELSSDSAAA